MRTLSSRLDTVLLVCRVCEKRSSGPKGLTAKSLAGKLKGAARDAGVRRARVVLTSCLGACPKKAITVAAMAPGRPATMLTLKRKDAPADAVAILFPPA